MGLNIACFVNMTSDWVAFNERSQSVATKDREEHKSLNLEMKKRMLCMSG
jgi:hypothetical protein